MLLELEVVSGMNEVYRPLFSVVHEEDVDVDYPRRR
jgi:hypothetical protein